MTTVATNLLGRWVKGRHVYENPDYVYPDGGSILCDYTRKQLKELTEYQKSYWTYNDVVEKIVAVTSEGKERYAELIFWVLIDGKPAKITKATVMPAGWEPEIPR